MDKELQPAEVAKIRAAAEKGGALTLCRKRLISICDKLDLLWEIVEAKDPEQHFEQIMSANKHLKSKLQAKDKENERRTGALVKYGSHLRMCGDCSGKSMSPCTCGYSAALNKKGSE